MQQKLSLAKLRVLRVAAVTVRTDVYVRHPDLPVFDACIAVAKVDASLANRFDLRPKQRHACLERLDNVIVVTGLAVLGDDTPGGLTRGLLGHVRIVSYRRGNRRVS